MKTDKQIILNRIRCVHCDDVITSYSVHDWKECKCKKIYVDGGTQYLRRGFENVSDYEELSVYDDAPFKIIRESCHWGTFGKSGNEPFRWVVISEMTNAHLNTLLGVVGDSLIHGSEWIRKLFAEELDYRKKNNIFIED